MEMLVSRIPNHDWKALILDKELTARKALELGTGLEKYAAPSLNLACIETARK